MRTPRLLLICAAFALLAPASASAAAFQNGGFESGTNPPASGTCVNLGSGVSATGWSVSTGPVKYCASGQAGVVVPGGSRAISLAAGSIQQTFNTVAGTTYLVGFNVNFNTTCGGTSGVLAVGADYYAYTYMTATTTTTPHLYAFTAKAATTSLYFGSSSGGSCGPILDDVAVDVLSCADSRAITDGSSGDTSPAAGVVSAGAGDRLICGSDGTDTLTGGSGNDVLAGLGGADAINGGTGYDFIQGGDGPDVLNGGTGNFQDRLFGGSDASTDRLIGGLGADDFDLVAYTVPISDPGIDRVDYSSDGHSAVTVSIDNSQNDTDSDNVSTEVESITGTAGADTITGDSVAGLGGDSHANTFSGRAGADTLNGGDGTDFFSGGDGGDTINGGTEADRITYTTNAGYATGNGVQVILDGQANDGVRTVAGLPGSAAVLAAATEGDNIGSDVEYFFGSSGNDRLDLSGYSTSTTAGVSAFGFLGDDYLIGSAGNDFLDGGGGSDNVDCGAGAGDIGVGETRAANCEG